MTLVCCPDLPLDVIWPRHPENCWQTLLVLSNNKAPDSMNGGILDAHVVWCTHDQLPAFGGLLSGLSNQGAAITHHLSDLPIAMEINKWRPFPEQLIHRS